MNCVINAHNDRERCHAKRAVKWVVVIVVVVMVVVLVVANF